MINFLSKPIETNNFGVKIGTDQYDLNNILLLSVQSTSFEHNRVYKQTITVNNDATKNEDENCLQAR